MLTKEELPECPVATTVQLIGNKWKLLIIRNLLQKKQRFTDFLKTIPSISRKDAKNGKDMSVCSFYVKCQHLNVKFLPRFRRALSTV